MMVDGNTRGLDLATLSGPDRLFSSSKSGLCGDGRRECAFYIS